MFSAAEKHTIRGHTRSLSWVNHRLEAFYAKRATKTLPLMKRLSSTLSDILARGIGPEAAYSLFRSIIVVSNQLPKASLVPNMPRAADSGCLSHSINLA